MAERERLVILPVVGGKELVARITPTGQFTPLEAGRRRSSVVPAELQGDLRNVAARVAFELQESNPNLFSEIDTSDPDRIAGGVWEESLSRLKKSGLKDDDLVSVIARRFGARGLTPSQFNQLKEDIKAVIDSFKSSKSRK
jgi:hypothetical protein